MFKEISYLRVRSLRTDILERVPMTLCTFIETFIEAFIYCFPMKKNNNRKLKT